MGVVQEIDDLDFLRSCLGQVDGFIARTPPENVIDLQGWEDHRKDLIARIAELEALYAYATGDE
ncbi:MAG: hypothetical protein PHH09_09385 [Methanoregulaceae archaeon]|nr:hypothetical protein [Methanoregulaceae archaeon]